MKPLHVGLAILVAVIWGFAFVATKLGLAFFTPPQLTILRFVVASLPVAFLPRPTINWWSILALGLFLYTGQFLLQFFGIANGMPAGLASVTVQTQALFTVLFVAFVLSERPTKRQLFGLVVAFAGLGLIALTVGADLTAIGLILTLGSAVSWAIGNVMLKRLPPVDMLSLVVYLSLVPPLPAFLISGLRDGWFDLPRALASASLSGLLSVLYLGAIATVFAYAVWGHLLRLYPAAVVTPFALLTPIVGAIASAIVFGEQFGWLRVGGIILMLVGLAIIVLKEFNLSIGKL